MPQDGFFQACSPAIVQQRNRFILQGVGQAPIAGPCASGWRCCGLMLSGRPAGGPCHAAADPCMRRWPPGRSPCPTGRRAGDVTGSATRVREQPVASAFRVGGQHLPGWHCQLALEYHDGVQEFPGYLRSSAIGCVSAGHLGSRAIVGHARPRGHADFTRKSARALVFDVMCRGLPAEAASRYFAAQASVLVAANVAQRPAGHGLEQACAEHGRSDARAKYCVWRKRAVDQSAQRVMRLAQFPAGAIRVSTIDVGPADVDLPSAL